MNPVVHSEIRSDNPDEARPFYGELFGWTFPEGGMPATPTSTRECRTRSRAGSARRRAVMR